MSPSPRLPRHPKPSASVESPLPDPVPKANCPGLIVSGSRGLKEAPERGARAGRVVQARGGASVPSSRSGGGPTGMHRLAVAPWSRSAPAGVSRRLASAAPVVLGSEGQDKVSPAPAPCPHSPRDGEAPVS